MKRVTCLFTVNIFRVAMIAGWLLVPGKTLQAQETVFGLLKSDAKKAAEYVKAQRYQQALEIYESLNAKDGQRYTVEIARTNYSLHRPDAAAGWYEKAMSQNKTLTAADLFQYAETRATLKQYDEAIALYSKYLQAKPDDPVVMKKIWRLRNRAYLYEDSVHYEVHPVETNSDESDLFATPYGDGFVFMSNRKRNAFVTHADGNQTPYYRLYFSRTKPDTVNGEAVARHLRPSLIGKNLATRFHVGPVSFFGAGNQMAYAATSDTPGSDGRRVLQLFFAELSGGEWKTEQPFPFNNPSYQFSDPFVTADGTHLFFTSDMPGGYGGKDLYVSHHQNGAWSKPVNLGENINTPGDECAPFVQGNNLYFASNGHGGLGGLDVFQAPVVNSGYGEPQNMGYPINTERDDFALTLTADGAQGFLTSNRAGGHDDIYAVYIDLQSYPVTIAGVIKYKEENWRDTESPRVLPHARLFLIDNRKNATVQTTTADADGNFTLSIPHYSQYRIRVVSATDGEESFVSLDLSRRRLKANNYEMVVVKSAFKAFKN